MIPACDDRYDRRMVRFGCATVLLLTVGGCGLYEEGTEVTIIQDYGR